MGERHALISEVYSKSELGSIQFSDTQYTESNRFSLVDGISSKLPNNKGSVLNISAPSESSSWCDVTGGLNSDNGNGDIFITRITFTVDPTLNNRNLTVELDIGGTQGVIWSKTERLARGAGVDTNVSLILPYYVLSTFYSNSGSINLTCDSDATIYNVSYLITKINKV